MKESVMSKVKEECFEVQGVVLEALRGKFRVEVKAEGNSTYEILAHVSGKMRQNSIKIIPGDQVKIEVSPYDLSKGRIVFRLK